MVTMIEISPVISIIIIIIDVIILNSLIKRQILSG